MAAAAARHAASKKRQEKLAEKRELEEERLNAKFANWLRDFDKDDSGTISRDELKHLLAHLNPDSPPTEEILDMLTKQLGNGSAPKQVNACVVRYEAYLKLGPQIDKAFDKFDKDGTGMLEKEVRSQRRHSLRRLRHVAPA